MPCYAISFVYQEYLPSLFITGECGTLYKAVIESLESTEIKTPGKFADSELSNEKVWQRLAASTNDVTLKQLRNKCAKIGEENEAEDEVLGVINKKVSKVVMF